MGWGSQSIGQIIKNMASSEELPEELLEPWEYTLHGNKHFGAYGSRDVLILVSSESGDEDIVARKKGELTQQDKDRLTSEGISKDCWEDDAKMMKERLSKNTSRLISVKVEDTPHCMNRKYVLSQITALFNNTTAQGGKISTLETSCSSQLKTVEPGKYSKYFN